MAVTLLDQLEDELKDCLCRMLEEEGRPVCACHHFAGETLPVSDRCDSENGTNGQAWLRRVRSSLSTRSGRATFGAEICGEGGWETVIELGIYRCISAVPDDQGNAPPVEAYNADRELLNLDKYTLSRVLCCETWENPDVMDGFSISSVQIEPNGPKGACSGSILTMVVTGDPMVILPDEAGFVSGPAGGGDSQLWPSLFD